MWKVLFRARDRFARDQRGNVAILFAFSAVPADRAARRRRRCDPPSALQDRAPERHGRGGDRAGPQRHERPTRRPTTSSTTTSAPMLPGGATTAMLHMAALRRHQDRGRLPRRRRTATWTPPSCRSSASTRCRSTCRPRCMTTRRQVRDRARARQHRLDGGATAASRRCATPPSSSSTTSIAEDGHRGPREDGARSLRDRRQHQARSDVFDRGSCDRPGRRRSTVRSTMQLQRSAAGQPSRRSSTSMGVDLDGLRRGARRRRRRRRHAADQRRHPLGSLSLAGRAGRPRLSATAT